MASAKSEARRYLGREDDYINLSGLNKERNIAKQVYNTNISSLENTYNDLLNTIASNRQKAATDFSKGRGTVSENAYLNNRDSMSNFSIRGVDKGINQLNKLGNSMETGRQYSNLANTFYNTMNELDATAKTGENDYNTNREIAQNTLSAALADIGAREANARNAYRAQVAQLAEQIQSRWDAQNALAAQIKTAQDSAEQEFKTKLYEKSGGKTVTDKTFKDAVKYYIETKGGTEEDAINYLNNMNIFAPTTQPITTAEKVVNKAKFGPSSNYLENYLYNSLLGLWR